MKKVLVIFLIMIISCVFADTLKDLRKRNDIILGFAEGAEGSIDEIAFTDLASEVSNWYLEDRGLLAKSSFGMRDRLTRMTEIWIKDFTDDITSIHEDELSAYYLEKSVISTKYQELKNEIHEKIETALEADELSKPGIYLRNLYWALILIDLIPGDAIEAGGNVWNYDLLVKKISYVVENVVVRLKSNDYHLGMRRLIFHVLLDERPVNDLRIGVVISDSVRGYSVENRNLQVDLFGTEFENLSNLSIKIDLQDELTWVWGSSIREMGDVTGMSGFEAYRTIPMRDVKIDYGYWDELEYEDVGNEYSQQEIEKNITGLLENIEFGDNRNKDIFSSESVKHETEVLLNNLRIRNLVTGDRIKYEETGTYRMWRGIKVGIKFNEGVESNCNLVIKTDRSNRISGVWLGMKPVDYRIAERQWVNTKKKHLFLETVEEMERRYTWNLLGRKLNEFGEGVKMPISGWKWGEIEKVSITEADNAAIYQFCVILSTDQKSFEHKYSGIKRER